MIYALATHEGTLYAATWEESADTSPRGHVYRLDGDAWVDCGSPWDCNAVTRLAVHEGQLYAGVSRVKSGGSGRPETLNTNPGGRILRYEGGTTWSDCGQLPDADFDRRARAVRRRPVRDTAVLAGRLPDGGPRDWEFVGGPGRRLLALGVSTRALYGAGNDHVNVDSAIQQTAAGIVVAAESNEGGGGRLPLRRRRDLDELRHAAGHDPGLFDRDATAVGCTSARGRPVSCSAWAMTSQWQNTGRLGEETEVMALASYNGMLYAGTLPHAEVYRYDGDGDWTRLRSLDQTPDVLYRRAHAMGVYRGALYCRHAARWPGVLDGDGPDRVP